MEIRISKNARTCTACGQAFAHGANVKSLVRFQDRELTREDYCAGCWTADRGANAYSAWELSYIDPSIAGQAPPEVFSPLRQIFYVCAESSDRTMIATAFLAAQLLRRQRVFRQIKESDDPDADVHIHLFTDQISAKLIEVRDPNLTYEELESGRRALAERLRALETPEEPQGETGDAERQSA